MPTFDSDIERLTFYILIFLEVLKMTFDIGYDMTIRHRRFRQQIEVLLFSVILFLNILYNLFAIYLQLFFYYFDFFSCSFQATISYYLFPPKGLL